MAKFKKGFTLIELLLVIVVLALLSTTTLPKFNLYYNRIKLESDASKTHQVFRMVHLKSLKTESDFVIYLRNDSLITTDYTGEIVPRLSFVFSNDNYIEYNNQRNVERGVRIRPNSLGWSTAFTLSIKNNHYEDDLYYDISLVAASKIINFYRVSNGIKEKTKF